MVSRESGKDGLKRRSRAMNGAIVVAIAVVALLAYGFIVRFAAPRVDPLRGSPAAGSAAGDRIQVELLNGCGVDNLAANARRFLRDDGFDIVGVGNFESNDVEQTYIVDHVGDGVAAALVATSLGVKPNRIRSERKNAPLLDVTVVFGHDYETLRFVSDH